MFRSIVLTATSTELSGLIEQLQDDGQRIRQIFQEPFEGAIRYRVFAEETKLAQQRSEIIADLQAGRSVREIAKYHDVSVHTVLGFKRGAQSRGVELSAVSK